MKHTAEEYLITDYPGVFDRLAKVKSRIQPEIYSLEEFLNTTLLSNSQKFLHVVFYISDSTLQNYHSQIHALLKKNPLLIAKVLIDADISFPGLAGTDLEDDLFFSVVSRSAPDKTLVTNLANAFLQLKMITERFDLQHKIHISSQEISKLTKIGISLANEKDFSQLLREILFSAMEIAVADSGSLYLVERDDLGVARNLRFKISALNVDDAEEFILPINKSSISGYVAATGRILNIPDAYSLPQDAEYKFNSQYDALSDYHSKSMLVVPMKNHRDEVVGVIQLINKKKNYEQKLTVEQMKGLDVLPFDDYTAQLVMGVAGQAAVAIQNNNLIQEIETLFEGFVKASVNAIEARDPTTSGHSFRVALLTVGLAEIVSNLSSGRFKDISFNKEQIKEIRYASLLHDFGKVGVREKVLVKAKKLEDLELEKIVWRFHYCIKDLEAKFAKKKVDYLKKHGSKGYSEFESQLDFEFQYEKERLLGLIKTIRESNEPSILEEGASHVLEEVSKMNYETTDGRHINLITPYEFGFLTIRKGSLDLEERREIESHVEHTFQFLSQIPWTSELKMVPEIAHAHHEKLDGSGYPLGLRSADIPVQSKMMTIADIFDALTDKDRPYKRAVPLERALDILHMEAKEKHVDQELLDVFIEAKIYEVLANFQPDIG